MAQFDRFWRPAVEQKEVGVFLRTQTDLFVEDLSQQPIFDEGFSALRRNQLIKLARKFGQHIDEDMPHTSMIPIFNAWWMQGFFHQKPVHVVNVPAPGKPADPTVDNSVSAMKWGDLKKLAHSKGYTVLPKMKRPEVEALFG